MTYKTGQRFKAKVCGEPATGTIEPMEYPKDHWYLLKPTGEKWYIGSGSPEDLSFNQVTDLELLPDVDEPQKGDLVEVSGDGNNWQNIVQWVYTGGQTKFGNHIVEYGNHIGQFKHIRLAASPEKLKREEAKQKAEKFMREHMPEMEGQSYGDHSKIMSAIALYILKEKM